MPLCVDVSTGTLCSSSGCCPATVFPVLLSISLATKHGFFRTVFPNMINQINNQERLIYTYQGSSPEEFREVLTVPFWSLKWVSLACPFGNATLKYVGDHFIERLSSASDCQQISDQNHYIPLCVSSPPHTSSLYTIISFSYVLWNHLYLIGNQRASGWTKGKLK